MKIRVSLVALCCIIAMMLLSSPCAGREKKDKKKSGVQVIDLSLPVPDAPLMPLSPQPMLAPESGVSDVAVVHVPNRRVAGIDVSHYQGRINWQEVARSGDVAYVYLKATEGANLVDNTYRTNLAGCRREGLKVGAYHFYIPSVSPQQQFQNFKNCVNAGEMDLIPIVDIERRGRESLASFQSNLKTFINLVERHYGVRPILYCSRDFYNKYLSGPFTSYKYMVARYAPDVPQLCDNVAFVMWQYSATSRVQGIRGNVDRSCLMDQYTLHDILLRPESQRPHRRR